MKTGRNEPCPCGSGKKFKKCCIGKTLPFFRDIPKPEKQPRHDMADRLDGLIEQGIQANDIGEFDAAIDSWEKTWLEYRKIKKGRKISLDQFEDSIFQTHFFTNWVQEYEDLLFLLAESSMSMALKGIHFIKDFLNEFPERSLITRNFRDDLVKFLWLSHQQDLAEQHGQDIVKMDPSWPGGYAVWAEAMVEGRIFNKKEPNFKAASNLTQEGVKKSKDPESYSLRERSLDYLEMETSFFETENDLFVQEPFESLEQLQSVMDGIVKSGNMAPQLDFQGLSPENMHQFLYKPFESNPLIQLLTPKHMTSNSPILDLFLVTCKQVGPSGLKLTPKGNFPVASVKTIAETWYAKQEYKKLFPSFKINREDDFNELSVLKELGSRNGLFRKNKGRLFLTKKTQTWLHEDNWQCIMHELLEIYARKFDWPYQDRYDRWDIIQASFMFSIFLLHKFGTDEHPESFYANHFWKAFGHTLQMEGNKNDIMRAYILRTIHRFTTLMGFTTSNPEAFFLCEDPIIKVQPLLMDMLTFNL